MFDNGDNDKMDKMGKNKKNRHKPCLSNAGQSIKIVN